MKAGVLALQGDFAAHARALARVGVDACFVRAPGDLAGIDALVLPGGESSAMLRGLERDGLLEPLGAFVAAGRPLLGTCAGAILLAAHVSPAQRSLGALDVDVERNAYGTQVHSFECDAEVEPGSPFAGLRCVLIRAPRITRAGPAVAVHARVRGEPALVAQGPVWAASFHPELTPDDRVLRAWLAASLADPAR